MKPGTVCLALALSLSSCVTSAQQSVWQQKMEESRRAAADGQVDSFVIGSGSRDAAWEPGAYVYYNRPRPFCYAYTIPGDWNTVRGRPGIFRSEDGKSVVSVTFLPPGSLDDAEGATMVERARNVAVRRHERGLGQPLAGVEFAPFESARPGTWLLKAAPVSMPNGRTMAFPLHIIVDLSPHTVAEINIVGTGDAAQLARRIIAKLRTTVEPECYLADVERLYKFVYGER